MIDFARSEDTRVNVPKFTEDKLVLRNNYFIVTDGQRFNSYSISIVPDTLELPIIRFNKNPPILLEGYAIVGKNIYKVTKDDLLRKVIRKSREINREALYGINIEDSTPETGKATGISGLKLISGEFEPGISEAAEVEISKAADAAFTEQIGSLFGPALEEEDENDSFWDEWDYKDGDD